MSVDLSIATRNNRTATRAAGGETVSVTLVDDQAQWDRLQQLAPRPHLPQGFAYGAGKAAKGWTVRRALFGSGGRPVAYATVLELKRLGIRLVARVNRGPVFLDDKPADADVIAVHKALRRRWRGLLMIAPGLDHGAGTDDLLRAAGFIRRQDAGWLSGRIDLARTEEQIWAGFNSTFRNRVRAAEKAGAELRIADDDAAYAWMLERHRENMREKGFNAVDATFLNAMRDTARDNVRVYQLAHEGKPLAGMSVVRFGEVAEYHIGWFGPEGRKFNAGNFLMWQIMRDLRGHGVKQFDVGGMKLGDGYTRFKRTMNPAEYQLAGEWVSF